MESLLPYTGKEFLDSLNDGREVWIYGGAGHERDGAAYDPATDTWRRLPDLPGSAIVGSSVAAWTGTELVVVGVQGGEQLHGADAAVADRGVRGARR